MRAGMPPVPWQGGRAIARALVLIAALCAGAIHAAPAAADSGYTFAPVADTYARSDRPAATFDGSSRISAMRARGQLRRAYLRFDVRLPAGARAPGGTLTLYAKAASG